MNVLDLIKKATAGISLQEVTPPGYEHVVKKLKQDSNIENPFAVAWAMKSREGAAESISEADAQVLDFEMTKADWAKLSDEEKKKYIAMSKKHDSPPSANPVAADSIPGVPKEKETPSFKESMKPVRFLSKFVEARSDSREVDVVIISEGLGNSRDKHFYTKQALQEAVTAGVFDGAQCYADHPTKLEESNRPERSVRDLIGYFSNVKFLEVGGKAQISGTLKVNEGDSFAAYWDLLKEAVAYSKKFPTKDYVGISINADGVTHPANMAEGMVNMVDRITGVFSSDVVTKPGRGGKVLNLRESVTDLLEAYENGEDDMRCIVEALSEMRKRFSDDEAVNTKYGEAMDQIIDKMMKVHSQEDLKVASPDQPQKSEGEGQPVKDNPPAKEEEMEGDQMYEAMKKKYKEGKLSEGEKAMFEMLEEEKQARRLTESAALLEKKLRDCKLPEATVGDLKETLIGKSPEHMDKMIEARKNLVTNLLEGRTSGNPASVSPKENGKLTEALREHGVPLRKEAK